MKKTLLVHLVVMLHLVAFPTPCFAVTSPVDDKKATVSFNFDNEDLVDVINYVSAKKNVNIIMPMGANTISSKISLHIDDQLTIDQAWELLITVLDIAGYSMIRKEDTYSIVKNNKAVSKDAIPLYVGSDAEKLPDTDERIRFLYYLSNIRVSDAPDSEIPTILKELLPAETASYQFDTKVNAVLITDKASNIKSVIKIIASLDQTTFQEKLDIISLRYTEAENIAKLFSADILKTDANKYRVTKGKKGETTYFSDQIKIIPAPRTNQLIILGKEQAVARVKEFIYKYIDVELESGQSILHVYQLLYLDAISFEPILRSIVEAERGGGTGQSAAGGAKSGVERYFEGVIIKADQPRTGVGKEQIYGSNKLIIAAKNDDWKYIKRLIEQLDRPQPQVIIEVLVADLTLDDLRQLGTQVRNPAALPLPGNLNIQSAQIGPVVLDPAAITPATTIGGDLLGRTIHTSSGNVSLPELTGPGQAGFPGSTLISVSDASNGKTWGLLQLLENFSHTKILSQPHIIACNNKEALVNIGQERLVAGETINTAAAPTVQNVKITANLTVRITPRISSANDVTLAIKIDIREFLSASSAVNTIITRTIETNAAVQSDDILALGGLIQTDVEETSSETPLLGRIPILGWLFKNRHVENKKTNLTVFISPTIIQPRLRGGVSQYTQEYIDLTKKYSDESNLFDNLRDPITRFFFRSQAYTQDKSPVALNKFLVKDEFKREKIAAPETGVVATALNNTELAPTSTTERYQRKSRNTILDAARDKPSSETPQHVDELKQKLTGIKNPLLHT